MSPAKISVLVGQRFACLKISGRANFSLSIDFRTLLNELQQRNYQYFVLDLSECILMDSTFLGVLAGFGLKMAQATKETEPRRIELLNPNPRVAELLESLGIAHLFNVTRGAAGLDGCREEDVPACAPASKEEITRACLEAHQTLMAINPQNIARFKDVAQFLAEDLKRPQA